MFDFDNTFRESVTLEDDSNILDIGRGILKLCIGIKIHVTTDVYYIPSPKKQPFELRPVVAKEDDHFVLQ